MSLALPALLVGVVFLIGALVFVVFIAFRVGPRSRMRTMAQPCCAACMYPVRGLVSLTCPECGSDLREVGILSPGMKRPMGPWLTIMLWTIALPIPALVLSGIITSVALPIRHQRDELWEVTAPSGPISHVELLIHATRLESPRSAGGPTASTVWDDSADQFELRLFRTPPTGGPPDWRLIVELKSNSWHTQSDPTQRPLAALDEAAVRAWLGLTDESADEQMTAIAAALVDLIRGGIDRPRARLALTSALNRPPMSDHFAARQSWASSMNGPIPQAMIALTLFWLAFWLVGCIMFYRRQNRTT